MKASQLIRAVFAVTVLATATLTLGAAASFADGHGITGNFTGTNDHTVSGSFEIVKSDDGYTLTLSDDFELDGAPDPKIAFGKNGYSKGTIFTKLNKLKGKQVYKLPASINPSDYNEVWIWCEKFDVGLGVAKVK